MTYFVLALLLVTRAWLFWMVAGPPENIAIFGFWARACVDRVPPANISANSSGGTEKSKETHLILSEDGLAFFEFIDIISVSSFRNSYWNRYSGFEDQASPQNGRADHRFPLTGALQLCSMLRREAAKDNE